MAVLTLITVPIGNLEDFTFRAQRRLLETKAILAEDTRNLKKLLKLIGRQSFPKMESFFEHSSDSKIDWLIEQMDKGEDWDLVSDAGSPIISDPAFSLVGSVLKAGHQLATIPGVSAPIVALELSALAPIPFSFHGFLPKTFGKVKALLSSLSVGTHIFFESPYRIEQSLKFCADTIPEANLVVIREMTKVFEQVLRIKACQAQKISSDFKIKGEFVLLVEINKQANLLSDQLTDLAQDYLKNRKTKTLSKLISKITGDSSQNIYNQLNRKSK